MPQLSKMGHYRSSCPKPRQALNRGQAIYLVEVEDVIFEEERYSEKEKISAKKLLSNCTNVSLTVTRV